MSHIQGGETTSKESEIRKKKTKQFLIASESVEIPTQCLPFRKKK